MTLNASDVEQKTFSTALRGYDLDEVDDFLDEVVATIRDLNEQLAGTGKGDSAPATTPAPAPAAAADESAVGRALITAQETADKIIAEARAEADRILGDARTEAETLISEKEQRRAAAESEMERLTDRVAGVRSQLAVLATEVADRLDEMDATIGAASRSDEIGETDVDEVAGPQHESPAGDAGQWGEVDTEPDAGETLAGDVGVGGEVEAGPDEEEEYTDDTGWGGKL